MIKRIRNKLFATLCVAALTLGAVAPSTFNTVHAAAKTVYVDVEKNITGQAPIVQPVAVTADDNATILDVTKQAAGAANVDASSSYVKAFKDSTPDFDYAYTAKVPAICYDTTKAYNQPIVNDPNWLREKEYNGISGWMFTVNNTDHDASYNYYTAATPLSTLPDGAVIRWEFSMACGCDLGNYGWVPDGTVTNGYYNWSAASADPFFYDSIVNGRKVRTDKTELIRKMANHNNKTDAAYTKALKDLKTLTSNQTQVNNDVNGL